MSILNEERKVLRQTYVHLDEALEFANSELNKASQNNANQMHRAYQDSGKSLQAIEDALKNPGEPPEMTVPGLAPKLADLLKHCYDLNELMRITHDLTQDVIELARQAQIEHHVLITNSEGDLRPLS